MQIVFIFVALIGIGYFLLGYRRFDFFSVAYFSACLYFLPGFFGYALHPKLGEHLKFPVLLIDKTYWVMLLVLLFLLLSAICFDLTVRSKRIVVRFSVDEYAILYVLFLVAVLSGCVMLATTGKYLLLPKSQMLPYLGRSYHIFVVSTALATTLAFSLQHRFAFISCIFLLCCDLFLGFRSIFVITFLAIVVLHLHRQHKERVVLQRWVAFVVISLATYGIMFYKLIYHPLKKGDTAALLETITDLERYQAAIVQSEPFTTQLILNEVLRHDLRISPEHLSQVFYQSLLFVPDMDVKLSPFHSVHKPILFPHVANGMANNIWAEMWSCGGFPLLILFIIIFCTTIFLGSFTLFIENHAIKSLVVLLFCSWGFYIHRNELAYQINIGKRFLIVWGASVLLSMLFRKNQICT